MGLGVWGMIHQWMVLKKIKQEKYQEALEPVACLLSEQLLESYILGIVGFRQKIDVNSLKMSLKASLGEHQRFSSVLDLESKMQNPTQAKWGNRLGFWLFPLPVVNYENPLEYCRAAAITSRRKKLSFEGSLSFAAVKYMAQIGAIKVIAYISNRVNSKATLLFSNIMGPVEEIQYGDNPVTHIIPTALINNTPIVIHFVSYAGKGKLVALVSEDVVPDPEQLCLDCADALQQMKEAALWHPENSYP